MDDEDLEYTLLNKRDVMVYQIPPASSSAGHKADDWKKCIWRGRLRMAGRGRDLTIKLLESSSGNLFAQCVIPGGDHASYVERVIDSSRYFVLKISNGDRHAFIGLGFEDRNDAFDFNVTLSDFKTTWVDREKEAERPVSSTGPSKDLSLKEGQTIKINLPGKSRRREEKAEGGYAGGFGGLAPPPPSAPSRRQEPAPAAAPSLSPPAAAPAAQSAPAAKPAADDFFGDFSDFQGAGGDPVASVSRGIEQMSFGGPTSSPALSTAQAPVSSPGFAGSDPFAGPMSAAPAPASRQAAPAADPFGGALPCATQVTRPAAAPAPAPFGGPPAASPGQAPDPFGGFGFAAPAPAKAAAPARPAQRNDDPFDGLDIFK